MQASLPASHAMSLKSRKHWVILLSTPNCRIQKPRRESMQNKSRHFVRLVAEILEQRVAEEETILHLHFPMHSRWRVHSTQLPIAHKLQLASSLNDVINPAAA